MQSIKPISSSTKALFLALAIGAGSSLVYLFKSTEPTEVKDSAYKRYLFNDDERDIKDVASIYADPTDNYLLHTRPVYDVRAMMSNRASQYDDPSTYGDLTIMIARDKNSGEFIGFTAHQKLSFFKSKLLFLAIAKDARGKGYGRTLAQQAIADMKREGARKVVLDVREENQPARTLYESLGFKAMSSSRGFVHYGLDLF
jgi:ribosomal protein S18 acetylase RimI-like enzyme